jgi:glycosyltransferase involved in cell wall biosynthesis
LTTFPGYRRNYPKVLVICFDSLNYRSGTGIVFSNLFRGWPADALAQIHVDDSKPDPEICKQYWRLSVENVPLDRAIRRILGRRRIASMGPAFDQSWSDSLEGTEKGAAWPSVRVRTLLSAWADCVPYHLDAAFLRWLRTFSPEVVFTNLGSIRQIRLAQRVAGMLKIPIVPFFNDDWPRTHFQADVLKAIPRWLILRRLGQLMKKATVGGAVSIPMAKEYQERYGIPFEPFMYCVDAPELPPPQPGGNEIIFCYVGGLHLDRWRSLVELGNCLDELCDTGLRAKLLIYAPQKDLERYGPQMSNLGALQLMGTLRAEEVSEVLERNHVLVHVESFHPITSQFTRLSFSTKIPQYLAAGRPVLAYGPKMLASCQYLTETGSGLVVGQQQRQQLMDALKRLGSDSAIRKEMGERAWRTARLKHESKSMRERFRAMLAGAAWPERTG